MRCSDFIFQYLADHGIDRVFAITGGGAMFLNDALGKEKRISPVFTHHEQAAAIAAEGFVRVTNRPAVVSVTTGPGGTNAITGVIGAWLDSIPVLYLSGQVKFPTSIVSCPELPLRQLGDQEINIIDLVKPVTKYAGMVTDPDEILFELEKALSIAVSGRPGPVWLDIPINVQSADIDPEHLKKFISERAPQPDLSSIPAIVKAMVESKAPVIIAGHGIRLDHADPEFEQLIRRLQIPVVKTFNAIDRLPSDDPLMMGAIGTIGTRGANIILQNADFVLSLGSRNNIRQTSYNTKNFVRNAKTFAVVDIDPAELKKPTLHPTHAVCSGIKTFLEAFLAALPVPYTGPAAWLNWCRAKRDAYDPVQPKHWTCTNGISPYAFTRILTNLLPENAIIACTNATPSIVLFQAGIIKRGDCVFCNSGCAAMGFGLPASLGAAAAANGRPVVSLEGDGSLMMNLQELQTIRAHRFPIKLFLYDNGEYASIRQTQDSFFSGRHTGCDHDSGVTFPDWAKVAAAFDWPYYTITSSADAERLLPEILAAEGPVFTDVKLTPGYIFEPKLCSKKNPDGTMESPSLENMFPFLPDEEMKLNIYNAEE